MDDYEETPVIDEQTGQTTPPIGPEHELTAGSPKPSNLLSMFGNVFLFTVLFTLGVGASVFLRQYLAQPQEETTVTPTPAAPLVPPTLVTQPADPYAGWKSYQPVSATTKQSIASISLKLPPEVLTPICDGPYCASQGTYLPGGTRLTIALRGKGQALPTTVGAIMTDAGGRAFVMKEASISGMPSQEFTGLFAGTTGGGYTFAQIRGVVVHGPEGISLEVNHFTPTGVAANWDTDDALFDKILETIMFAASEK